MKERILFKNSQIYNDRGSTLITVIVAIAFVTILTSIILGTTAVNVRMKGIDRRTKDDFYYAERSLNDIYTGIGQELANIAAVQYEAAFEKVGNIEGANDYNVAETAEKEFRKQFMTNAAAKISALTVDKLEDYIQPDSKGNVASIGTAVLQKKDGTETTNEADAYRIVIPDVQVYVEDAAKFRSTIITDIVVTLPTLDFLGTNADVSDYGLIANEGLYITGGSSGCKITGNVYAGVHSDYRTSIDKIFRERTDQWSRTPIYGGINIQDGKVTFDGNYVISKGDINLSGTNPQIEVNSSAGENLANLWFTSLRTITYRVDEESGSYIGANITNAATDPTINLNANIFALNDLALNADKSSAVIKGNYYGYNEGGLSDILHKKTKRDDGGNSAIIVNGSKSSLDMKDVNNFVLMGKAYIDFTSDPSTDAATMDAAIAANPDSYSEVVPTAESVALKTNQQLYLVPPDFLDGPNPAEDSANSHTFTINVPTADLQRWFGYRYLNSANIDDPYKVKLTSAMGGTNVFYDYLVFDDGYNWKPTPVSSLGTDDEENVYIVKKDGAGYKFVKYTRSTDALGTGGSISSKAMFFLKIMMSENEYDYRFSISSETDKTAFIENLEKTRMQPSEYRLRERINLSMTNTDYFDLSQCVVGGSAGDAHYYAKNAVINYEKVAGTIQSNVLDNTDGMGRYVGYTQNLFHRYVYLCTKLDGKETKLLENEPENDPSDTTEWTNAKNEWKITTTAPLSHFVKTGNLSNMNIARSLNGVDSDPTVPCATKDGLKPSAFGVVVAKNSSIKIPEDLPSGAMVGNTFKGVAIADGDITVKAGTNVEGLLMATGTIKLLGNNTINYDKGLIQSRIDKEMNIVKNKMADTPHIFGGKTGYTDYYLISYLSRDASGSPLMYDVTPGTKIKQERVDADYNEFMHYENWQKGEQ